MVFFSQTVVPDSSPHSSGFILMSLAALAVAVLVFYYLGLIRRVLHGVGVLLRGSVRLGFMVWRSCLSWANWPEYLVLLLGMIIAGVWSVSEYPLLALVLGGLELFLGIIACLAFLFLDLERYEVERGYKALHNPLKGQEPARDLARYGPQVGVPFLCVAAIGIIGGFALLNLGLYYSVGHAWYYQELGEPDFIDFLVYALLNLYQIVDLLDLAHHHRLVNVTHLRPVRWPATVLLSAFKTFFTFVLLEQIFASVRKGKLLSETITDFFSPHLTIHERARHALPQYGIRALKPLFMSLRSGPAMTKEQREELPKILADIGPGTIPGLIMHLNDSNEQVRAVAVAALGYLQALEALPSLASLEGDASETVRLCLVEALGTIVNPGVQTVRKKHWLLSWQAASTQRLSWLWKRRRTRQMLSDPVTLVIAQLRQALRDTSPLVRTMAARTLSSLGKAATSAAADLLPLLADTEEMVRRQAAEALRSVGADASLTVQALLPLLHDPSPAVRAAVADTLGTFQEQVEAVTAALVPLLQDRDELVRQKAAEALGKASTLSPAATESLVQRLRCPDALIRAQTAEALGNIGAAAETTAPALIEAMKDDNDRVRAKAVKAVGKMGAAVAATAMPTLVRALRDPDTWVQALAAEALGEMGEAADQAIPALMRSLRHANAQVRYHAAESLGKLGSAAAAALPALAKASQDADAGVRALAVRALGEVGPGACQDQLRQACCDVDPQVRLAAVAACGALEAWQEATRQAVFGLLDDADDQVKVQAARVLTKTLGAETSVVAHLIRMVQEDDNVWVQAQAASVLGSLGPPAAAAGPSLVQAATTQEASVREAAMKALVQIQPPEALGAFILGLKDDVADIRKVASAGWRKAPSLPEEALPGLVQALHDPERQVRANAAYALHRLEELPPQAIPLLLECANHPSDELRLNAILALQKVPAKEIQEVMERLIKDPTPRIRFLAAGSLLMADAQHAQAQVVVLESLVNDASSLRKATLGLIHSLGPVGLFCLPALTARLDAEQDEVLRADLHHLILKLEGLQPRSPEPESNPMTHPTPALNPATPN